MTLIEDIIKQKPQEKNVVEFILNIRLDKNYNLSNQYYSIYDGGKTSFFEEVEVRLPSYTLENKECRMLFTIQNNQEFTKQKIIDRYNQSSIQATFVPPQPTDMSQTNYIRVTISDAVVSYEFKKESIYCSRIIISYKF